MKERVFKSKFDKVVIKKSPRSCGYLASYYTAWSNTYAGCEHFDNLEEFIKYRLNYYEEVKE